MKKNVLIFGASLLALTSCGGEGDSSVSSNTQSSDTPVTPISEKKIYDRLMEIGDSLEFRMTTSEGDYTIYNHQYIEYSSSQSGIAKVRGFEEEYPEILMGFNYSLDGETKKYALNMVSQESSDDFETPATDLNDYIYFSLLTSEDLDITVEDITLYDDGETYGIVYDNTWTSDTKNMLFFLAAGQLGYYSYATSDLVSEILFSFDREDNLVISMNAMDGSGNAFHVSNTFDQIGTAKDKDLETFLNSQDGQVPAEKMSDSIFASLTAKSLSATTTFSVCSSSGALSEAVTHVDYTENAKHIYVEESPTSASYYRKNANGNYDNVYIDGQNKLAYEDSEKPFESLGFAYTTIRQEDLRANSNNASSFHYYGLNENAIIASLMGMDALAYYGLSVQNMTFEVSAGKVKEINAQSYSFLTQTESGYARVFFDINIKIEDTLTLPGEPTPYESDANTSKIKEIFDTMNSYDKIAFHNEESVSTMAAAEHPWMEQDSVYTSSLQYTKTTQWSNNYGDDWTEQVSVTGYIDKGEAGVMPFAFYPNGIKEASGPLAEKSVKEAAPFPLDAAPELFTLTVKENVLKPKDSLACEVLYPNLPLGPYGSVFPESDIIIRREKDDAGANTDRISSIEYTIDLQSFGVSMTIIGKTTFTYGDEVIVDEDIKSDAEALPLFVTPTNWSSSYSGEKIKEVFDTYFKGCKDKDGNTLSVDDLPYFFIEGYDRNWSAYAWANGELHIDMTNYDKSFRTSIMDDFRASFEASQNYEKRTKGEKTYYVNGDLCVYVSDWVDDGLVLTKTSDTFQD